MEKIKKTIRKHYNEMTSLEKSIAKFFFHNQEDIDFSSKNISRLLYVSDATLSRFAKKCGYDGYREFISIYKRALKDVHTNDVKKQIIKTNNKYEEIFDMCKEEIRSDFIFEIAKEMKEYENIFICAEGMSTILAKEMCNRFRHLGFTATDFQGESQMKLAATIAEKNYLYILFSSSCHVELEEDLIRIAANKGAKTLIITSIKNDNLIKIADYVILLPYIEQEVDGASFAWNIGYMYIIDLIYEYYMDNISYEQMQCLKETKWTL